MNKLEAWKAWHESVGIGVDATEYSLEKSSHGKAFSYAWDAAVKAEREACAKLAGPHLGGAIAAAIRARGET